MRLSSLFIFSVFFILSCKPASDKVIAIGEEETIYSNILQERRNILIHVPERSILSSERFNVVYLLDGENHFHSVVGLIHQMSSVNNEVCPKMIVVGIRNTDRTRDLTPNNIVSSPYMDKEGLKSSGGGQAFIRFIEKELVPFIDSQYPTSSHRILVGHSFGGLTVVNTLINKPDLFTSYIAIDPSMWWDDQKFLKNTEVALNNKKLINKSLFLAVANTVTPDMDTSEIRKDQSATSLHFRSNLQFANILENNTSGLKFKWKYYKEENHSSVPLIAEYDALRFLFNHPVKAVKDGSSKNDSIIAMKSQVSSR